MDASSLFGFACIASPPTRIPSFVLVVRSSTLIAVHLSAGQASRLSPYPVSMADSQQKEIDAFLSFLATFTLSRPVLAASDLSDGAALFEVLQVV